MITYQSGGVWYLLKLFQLKGSVFPSSILIAAPCGAIAFILKLLIDDGYLPLFEHEDSIVKETQAWSGFSSLVGFLIVFRTSQAYNRFWDGCTATHAMRAEWFDACSALVAFCKYSKANEDLIQQFKHLLIRLFSMLHAAALAELEELNHDVEDLGEIAAFTFDLIDPRTIDEESLQSVKTSSSKVELLFSWIQLVIVENMETGVLSIPPPILSRAFQEIANGMVAFHDAVKITYIPFPFPYAQTCDCLLVLHWMVAPFVTAHWVTQPIWAAVFVFIQVFILWCLNFIAVEIENPFGTDANDLDGRHMQKEMNRHLLLLLHPSTIRAPLLIDDWRKVEDDLENAELLYTSSFLQVFTELTSLGQDELYVGMSARKVINIQSHLTHRDRGDSHSQLPPVAEEASRTNGHGTGSASKYNDQQPRSLSFDRGATQPKSPKRRVSGRDAHLRANQDPSLKPVYVLRQGSESFPISTYSSHDSNSHAHPKSGNWFFHGQSAKQKEKERDERRHAENAARAAVQREMSDKADDVVRWSSSGFASEPDLEDRISHNTPLSPLAVSNTKRPSVCRGPAATLKQPPEQGSVLCIPHDAPVSPRSSNHSRPSRNNPLHNINPANTGSFTSRGDSQGSISPRVITNTSGGSPASPRSPRQLEGTGGEGTTVTAGSLSGRSRVV